MNKAQGRRQQKQAKNQKRDRPAAASDLS